MNNEPQTFIIYENSPISAILSEPFVRYLAEDEPSSPVPPPATDAATISVAHIIAGLLDSNQKQIILNHLLSDQQKSLLDSATSLVVPNALVLRNADGTISGVSTGSEVSRNTYLFDTPLSVWTITHNLNSYPEVIVLDDSGEEIFPDVEYTSTNVVTIRHGSPYTGKVILTGKVVSGNVYLFNTPSAVWIVTHNLNSYPEIVVLDETGEEIMPDIEYTSENVITIRHGGLYIGKVILT